MEVMQELLEIMIRCAEVLHFLNRRAFREHGPQIYQKLSSRFQIKASFLGKLVFNRDAEKKNKKKNNIPNSCLHRSRHFGQEMKCVCRNISAWNIQSDDLHFLNYSNSKKITTKNTAVFHPDTFRCCSTELQLQMGESNEIHHVIYMPLSIFFPLARLEIA